MDSLGDDGIVGIYDDGGIEANEFLEGVEDGEGIELEEGKELGEEVIEDIDGAIVDIEAESDASVGVADAVADLEVVVIDFGGEELLPEGELHFFCGSEVFAIGKEEGEFWGSFHPEIEVVDEFGEVRGYELIDIANALDVLLGDEEVLKVITWSLHSGVIYKIVG